LNITWRRWKKRSAALQPTTIFCSIFLLDTQYPFSYTEGNDAPHCFYCTGGAFKKHDLFTSG
jgi:hypothetical protein